MTPTNLFDLMDVIPSQVPANIIPFWDGCNWIAIPIPAGITCVDVQTCIDCPFLSTFFTSSNGSITMVGCDHTVNMSFINNNFTSSFVGTLLTIGINVFDLSSLLTAVTFTINDGGTTTAIDNTDVLVIGGQDGLRFFVTAVNSDTINIGLPLVRSNGQVLTWDAVGNTSYWADIAAITCTTVQNCMTLTILGLQNQIDTLATIITSFGIYSANVVTTAVDTASNPTQDGILVDATAGNRIITLHPAASAPRRRLFIKKIDATINTVTIDAFGAETIDGAATQVITGQWQSLDLISNGVSWFIVANY